MSHCQLTGQIQGGKLYLKEIKSNRKKTKRDHLLAYLQIYSSLFTLLYYYVYRQIRVVSPFVLPLVSLRVGLRVRTPDKAMSKVELFVKRKLGQTSTKEMYVVLKWFPPF